MSEIPQKLAEHLENLSFLTDRQERIEMLIAYADLFVNKDAVTVPRKIDAKIPGCESEVFVVRTTTGFAFAVDNPQGISAMAMAFILEDSLEGASSADIELVSEEIVFDIFGKELSMGKNLGLSNMLRMVKTLARR